MDKKQKKTLSISIKMSCEITAWYLVKDAFQMHGNNGLKEGRYLNKGRP